MRPENPLSQEVYSTLRLLVSSDSLFDTVQIPGRRPGMPADGSGALAECAASAHWSEIQLHCVGVIKKTF